VIASITPTSVSTGTQLAIAGSGFGATEADGYVMLNNMYGAVLSWSDTQIVVTVQPGTSSGNLYVHQHGFNSNAVPFTSTWAGSAPAITNIPTSSGYPWDGVIINGVNFGAVQGTSCLTFNGVTGWVTSWSDNFIQVAIPWNATTGNIAVTVNGIASNAVPFTVLTPPAVTSVSPSAAAVGTIVTISGIGFGAGQGWNYVQFNGATAAPTAWSDNSITVAVPNGATTGDSKVVIGYQNAAFFFTVTPPPPTISGLSPTSGLVGAAITIDGANFGTSQGNSTVTFNGVTAMPTSWSTNAIGVPVPSGATSGNIVVTVNGVSSNGVNFTIPTLASVSISPSNTSIAVGTMQQYRVTGIYSDGTKLALGAVAWTASAPAVATIDSAGKALAVSQGPTTIQAATGGVIGSTTLAVTPSVGRFVPSGSLITPREAHTATLLNNGQVLIAGGQDNNSKNIANAELYDLTAGTFTATGNLNTARKGHIASLLNNGMVLIAGGQDINARPLAGAELYDPATGTFYATGNLNTPRQYATATVLKNGKVLVAGGYGSPGIVASAEIYDPVSGTFTPTGDLNTERIYHSATLLNNGTVLIAGGQSASVTALSSAELYDPSTGAFTATANLHDPRNSHTATLLNNETVLITQGVGNSLNVLGSGEIYDPSNGTFSYTVGPNTARNGTSSTLLNNGTVLMAGGYDSSVAELSGAEIYDPVAASYATVANLNAKRNFHTATLLNNGNILLAGGLDNNFNPLGSVELYQPVTTTPRTLSSISLAPSSVSLPAGTAQRFVATGTFSDGSVQTVVSASWSSSNPGVVSVTNDSTNFGAAFAIAAGDASINACAGSVCGSVSITVPSSQLSGITIIPANPACVTGSAVALSATGIYSSGATEDSTASVTWASSSSSIAAINAKGMVTCVSSGTSTITASSGNTIASTSLSVTPPIASIAIGPLNPSLLIGGTQQFTAAATYKDGTTSDVTNTVQWASAAPQMASIGLTGALTALATGTTRISASSGGITASTNLTVKILSPSITSVSPSNGIAGAQVSISGSGFGSSQGRGAVWLGSTPGVVLSWSDTSIIATVASGSSSGKVQIQQNGLSSNQLSFTVSTPNIVGVTPTSGTSGTQVTVSGSGFGSVQGSGQVWLGTAQGQVSSWSDTQVVATVASDSKSGNAQILQNGVLSNSVAFTVTGTPHITGITPKTGSVGTVVTIRGTGFGYAQGNGVVWIGGRYASVTGWSDTLVLASLEAGAVSGSLKIQQDGVWSNSVAFAVKVPGTTSSVTLVPNVISMVVGDTRSFQVLDSKSQPIAGLAWSSSDTKIATLSTDDPPVITAVAPGTVTIFAGSASADVTVYSGPTLPVGTIQWSNPGDGSGVGSIIPAVPSATGVADVFAWNGSGNVQAVRSDGTVAWAAAVQGSGHWLLPDFQGGVVVAGNSTVYKLDGLTGQPYSMWTANTSEDQINGDFMGAYAIHTDGTIFTIDFSCTSQDCGTTSDPETGAWVVGIDPLTGQSKFKVQLANQNDRFTTTDSGSLCGTPGSHTLSLHPWPSWPIIAGDGSFYTTYLAFDLNFNTQQAAQQHYPDAAYPLFNRLNRDLYDSSAALADLAAIEPYVGAWQLEALKEAEYSGDMNSVIVAWNNVEALFQPNCNQSASGTYKLHLLKVGSDGSSRDTIVREWPVSTSKTYNSDDPYDFTLEQSTQASTEVFSSTNIITNADSGVLLSWWWGEPGYCPDYSPYHGGCTSGWIDGASEYHLTTSGADGIASDAILNAVTPAQDSRWPRDPINPILQLQDGTFVGTVGYSGTMVAFDQSGNVKGIASSNNYDSPYMATPNGGVISYGGVTYDATLNITGQLSSFPTQSWTGNGYQLGSVEQVAYNPIELAASFAAVAWGNLSGTGTAARPWQFALVWQNDFVLYPDNPHILTNLQVDITPQAMRIKAAALAAFKKAFVGYPVTVYEGTTNTGDHRANIVNGYYFDQTSGSDACGLSFPLPGTLDSKIYYVQNMNQAQWALPIKMYNSTDVRNGATRFDLMDAIGTGIGNNAAHEIAHQFLVSNYGLDDSSTYTYNGQGCIGDKSPWVYTGSEIHWENVTKEALRKRLNGGWHK